MKKASRACSFAEAGGAAVPGGTTRSKQMAIQSVESWAWQWWETLTPIVQASLRGQKHVGVIDAEAAPAAKRIKKLVFKDPRVKFKKILTPIVQTFFSEDVSSEDLVGV